MELEPAGEDEGWKVEAIVPLAALPYSQLGTTYVLLAMPEEGGVTGSFNATLKFQVKDVDPTTGEPESDEHYDDSYVVRLLGSRVIFDNCRFSAGRSGNRGGRSRAGHFQDELRWRLGADGRDQPGGRDVLPLDGEDPAR